MASVKFYLLGWKWLIRHSMGYMTFTLPVFQKFLFTSTLVCCESAFDFLKSSKSPKRICLIPNPFSQSLNEGESEVVLTWSLSHGSWIWRRQTSGQAPWHHRGSGQSFPTSPCLLWVILILKRWHPCDRSAPKISSSHTSYSTRSACRSRTPSHQRGPHACSMTGDKPRILGLPQNTLLAPSVSTVYLPLPI